MATLGRSPLAPTVFLTPHASDSSSLRSSIRPVAFAIRTRYFPVYVYV